MNKASGEFQVSYFKSWKMMLWKCCTQYASKFGTLSSWPQDWKKSVFIPIPEKGNAKECSNYRRIALVSHDSKVKLKILQARLEQYVNRVLPNVQADFRKARGTRDQIANLHWIIEKAREFHRNIYFCFIDYSKAFDCLDHNKLENSERDGNTSPPDLPLEKTVCRQQLKVDMEQQAGSK